MMAIVVESTEHWNVKVSTLLKCLKLLNVADMHDRHSPCFYAGLVGGQSVVRSVVSEGGP